MTFQEWLSREGACDDGVTWVGGKPWRAAWEECRLPAWLFWLAWKCGAPDKELFEAALILWTEELRESGDKGAAALEYIEDLQARSSESLAHARVRGDEPYVTFRYAVLGTRLDWSLEPHTAFIDQGEDDLQQDEELHFFLDMERGFCDQIREFFTHYVEEADLPCAP